MGTQWGWHIDQEDCPAMPLGERIRQLRKEAGWSQAELAEKIAADAGRVNKYEAGRMAPAAESLVRLAEVLNVSIDYLLIDDVPRRPLHSAEDALGDRLAVVGELADEDLNLVVSFIDALVAKTRMKALTASIN
ncbi:MAG: helix-turn-helix transcriptional regulator [Acidimicrobiales bacterium]